MTETNESDPRDLTGTVDERISQLREREASTEALTAEWLRRQLHSALEAWAAAETEVDIEVETRTDY